MSHDPQDDPAAPPAPAGTTAAAPLHDLAGQLLAVQFALRGLLLGDDERLRPAIEQLQVLRVHAIANLVSDELLFGIDRSAQLITRASVRPARYFP